MRSASPSYRDALGLQPKNREDDFAYLIFNNQSAPGLALISMESADKNISDSQVGPKEDSIHRTYIAVFLEDENKAYDELKAKGVHFLKAPTTYPWGQRTAYFEDPEGNLWEISHFPKK